MLRTHHIRLLTIPLWALAVLILGTASAETIAIDQIEDSHEHDPKNLFRVGVGLYSGGEPRGPAMFAALKKRGIRTAISVDGLAPDLESAQQLGIEYVHIPIGYDSIPLEAAAAIAKTLEERQGPFYIHCHHGKHRGPAMAAIAMRLKTQCNDEDVRSWLRRAGVSETYRGLWRDAIAFRTTDIEGIEAELRSVSIGSDFASAMAKLDRNWDRLKRFDAADWKPLPNDPDIAAAHEALMLHEHFQELDRRGLGESQDPEFAQSLHEATKASAELLNAVRQFDHRAKSAAIDLLRKSCKDCHSTWRD
jgi:hypothetical protein